MNNINQIGFISTRIRQLKSAVMHTVSNEVLNLPDITVHAIDVDAGGFVWFTILKPPRNVVEEEKSFYVSLDFFRETMPFCLNISGVARLITSKEEIATLPEVLQEHITPERLMVSVKIKEVDYYEEEEKENETTTWFQKCRNFWNQAFSLDEYYTPFHLRSAN